MPSDCKSPAELLQRAADIGAQDMPSLASLEMPRRLSDPILGNTDSTSCRQSVRINLFFDGTGNNLEADTPDMGHSNVARLFRAHPEDREIDGLYRLYVPGIGTYFRQVGDPGGTLLGKGAGDLGQARLDFATAQVKTWLEDCDRRASRSPTSKVVDIKLAVFGFSRGAALARAFCRDLGKLCPDGRYKLKASGSVPIEVVFLGIFDTVASVGLPTAVNTTLKKIEDFLTDLSLSERIMKAARSDAGLDPLAKLAFGKSGAQPATGPSNGHYDWARDMRIGPIVKHGLHLVAGHEFRNAFPLDSVLQDGRYSGSVKEIVLPGAHSDVGGGYEPSEGGKSVARGSSVSMVALWMMYNEAGRHVPFYPTREFAEHNRQDFGIDDKSKAGHAAMVKAYQAYLDAVPAADGLGKSLLAHTRLYYAWRFRAVARTPKFAIERERSARQRYEASKDRLALLESSKVLHNQKGFPWSEEAEINLWAARHTAPRDEADWHLAQHMLARSERDGENVRHAEEGFKGQRATLGKAVRMAYDDWRQAQLRADRLQDQKRDFLWTGIKWPAPKEDALQHAKAEVSIKEDAWLRAKARLDTKADDSELLAHIHEYDAQLMEDAIKLDAWSKQDRNRRLRPHYQAILDAYRNEFELGRGLFEPAVIDFFDSYVHDSLAAFHKDDTRVSDPRVVYAGSDRRLDYALDTHRAPAQSVAG